MLYTTHLVFANIIYKNILTAYGIRLRKSSFIYGNIKPDMSSMIVNIPHNIDESGLFILNEIEILINEVNSLSQLRTREFARKLGIITHYVSDYFCLPHNKGFMNEGIVKHMLYERRINKLCREQNGIMAPDMYINDFKDSEYESIREYLTDKHNKYCCEGRFMQTDINYAVQTSMVIAIVILERCIQQCIKKAA